MNDRSLPHVVILGAGFAGLECAKALKRAPVRITLVDRQNHHLFQPLLYQVATAGLAAPDIAAPIRKVLRRQQNVRVLLDEAVAIHPEDRAVQLKHRGRLAYDHLVVATGATHSYFGHDAWAAHAPGLKSIADAFEIRRRVLMAFEAAEREGDDAAVQEWLTFVVVGGGPTGVELAGAIAEIAKKTMAADFRAFDPRQTRVVLVEGGERILAAYPPRLSEKAKVQLEQLGVEVRTGQQVSHIDERGVQIGEDATLTARTVLWGAGVAGSPLGDELGVKLGPQRRVPVGPTLQLDASDRVYVVGDLAWRQERDEAPVPALAPAAAQMGKHAAKNIARAVRGLPAVPFRYLDKGSLATIGRSRAVGQIGRLQLSGLPAWLGWLFVHLLFLVGFRNRLVVLFEWAWAYLTFQRSSRIILSPEGAVSTPLAPHPDRERDEAEGRQPVNDDEESATPDNVVALSPARRASSSGASRVRQKATRSPRG